MDGEKNDIFDEAIEITKQCVEDQVAMTGQAMSEIQEEAIEIVEHRAISKVFKLLEKIKSLESKLQAADALAKAAKVFAQINSGLSGMESYQALAKKIATYEKAREGW